MRPHPPWLSDLVYPALGAWADEQRRGAETVHGYPSRTVEGRFRDEGDAALISGQGLRLLDQSEEVTRVDDFLQSCASEVDREIIDQKWIYSNTEEVAALRCGFGSRAAFRAQLMRIYERLHGYLRGRHT